MSPLADASIPNQGSRRYSGLIFATVIALAAIVAIWLRWWGLNTQSLWTDEGYSVWVSHFQPKEIWRILRTDTSTPLYYVALHYWSALFGNSESALRALSALLATLSLPLLFLIASKVLANRTSVALAIALYAFSFFQIWYAQEARCYALLAFLSLASVECALLCLEKPSPPRLLGLALALSASLYTQNMAFFYLPGLAVLWFVYPSQEPIGARSKNALIVAAFALISYIPWLPSSLAQLRMVRGSFWVPEPRPANLLATTCVLGGFDTRTLQNLFRAVFHTRVLFGFWTWVPAFVIVLLLCAAGALLCPRPVDRRKGAALLAYSLLPVLLVFVYSRLFTPVYLDRVFVGAAALLPLMLCAPCAFQVGNRKRLFQLLVSVVLVGTAASAFGYLRRERREDWRGATGYLLKLHTRPRLVVVDRDLCLALVHYYATGLFKFYPPVEITGVKAKFDPSKGFQPLGPAKDARALDPTAVLSRAMDSRKYREIDFAFQPDAPSVTEVTDYLNGHCAFVEAVDFHWIEVRRCFVQSREQQNAFTSTAQRR
jgi:4-amino-4-deoxy-L-arabinose transferase-like glycosyltransferase